MALLNPEGQCLCQGRLPGPHEAWQSAGPTAGATIMVAHPLLLPVVTGAQCLKSRRDPNTGLSRVLGLPLDNALMAASTGVTPASGLPVKGGSKEQGARKVRLLQFYQELRETPQQSHYTSGPMPTFPFIPLLHPCFPVLRTLG